MTNIDERYKKAKIYKLTTGLTTDVYIGSTILKLNDRLDRHKSHYKRFIKGESGGCSSFRLLEKGLDDVEMQLVEDYNCNCRRELEIRERYWIENTVNCINKFIPTRTGREWHQAHREKMKEYRQENKQTIREKAKVKTKCECGSVITKSHLQQHKKTKKHTNYIATQITENITQLKI
jgi:hypothetical protein